MEKILEVHCMRTFTTIYCQMSLQIGEMAIPALSVRLFDDMTLEVMGRMHTIPNDVVTWFLAARFCKTTIQLRTHSQLTDFLQLQAKSRKILRYSFQKKVKIV